MNLNLKVQKHLLLFFLWSAIFSLSGCSQRGELAKKGGEWQKEHKYGTLRSDPFEGFNRKMWHINYDLLDPLFLRPIAVVWHDGVPRPIRVGVVNLLSNLDEVSTSVNFLLQLQLHKTVRHFVRFVINTVWGIGGLIDVASMCDIPKEDHHQFSDVLGYYGVDHGPYLMLPGFGPMTPRRTIGRYVDLLYLPLSMLNVWWYAGKVSLEGIENRANMISQEIMLRQSADSYTLFREIYLQRLDFLAKGERGSPEGNDLELEEPKELLDLD